MSAILIHKYTGPFLKIETEFYGCMVWVKFSMSKQINKKQTSGCRAAGKATGRQLTGQTYMKLDAKGKNFLWVISFTGYL